jgi:hypothetical protein
VALAKADVKAASRHVALAPHIIAWFGSIVEQDLAIFETRLPFGSWTDSPEIWELMGPGADRSRWIDSAGMQFSKIKKIPSDMGCG